MTGEFNASFLQYFAELQYLAQWQNKYEGPSWSAVMLKLNAKLSREQIDAMFLEVKTLLDETESSGEPMLTRLDRITKWFFVEWLNIPGKNDFLRVNKHPLEHLSRADIQDIFGRMKVAHENARAARTQYHLWKGVEFAAKHPFFWSEPLRRHEEEV